MRERNDEMLQLVNAAFADVRLGGGVSLRETLVVDNHGTTEQRLLARRADETLDWHRVVSDPELTRLAYIGGIAFYDPEGMRFHLPAYLSLAITRFEERDAGNVLEVLMNTLTRSTIQTDERFSLLNQTQRRCISEVLSYLRATYELESPKLDAAVLSWQR